MGYCSHLLPGLPLVSPCFIHLLLVTCSWNDLLILSLLCLQPSVALSCSREKVELPLASPCGQCFLPSQNCPLFCVHPVILTSGNSPGHHLSASPEKQHQLAVYLQEEICFKESADSSSWSLINPKCAGQATGWRAREELRLRCGAGGCPGQSPLSSGLMPLTERTESNHTMEDKLLYWVYWLQSWSSEIFLCGIM